MANVFDYLKWRGDLRFSQEPLNAIDAMIFSSLVYLQLEHWALDRIAAPLPLWELSEKVEQDTGFGKMARTKHDIALLHQAASTKRFADVKLAAYRNTFEPEHSTQFAAMAFLLDDDTMCIAFRGTDSTLTGWQENFNMSFAPAVPAQRLALAFTHEMQLTYMQPLSICGHSKGGNLAIFAAAHSSPMFQQQIENVYNFDGPGFTEFLIDDPGYLKILPKIHTYIPQSSIVGMMMNREEPITIVHSSGVGALQHDTYNWEVHGKEFVVANELTADSRLIDSALKKCLRDLNLQEREKLVTSVFEVLRSGESDKVETVFSPHMMKKVLKHIATLPETQRRIAAEIVNLVGKTIAELPEKTQ